MRIRSRATAATCCALALSFALGGCGGAGASSSGASQAAASSAAGAQSAGAQASEAKAALDEGIGYWFGTGESGYDMEKARAAFQQAVDKGDAEGYYWLGQLRLYDVDAERWPEVIELYQKAADNGCAKGLCGLGRLYERGHGVEANGAKAAELFQQAIDAGEPYGYACLAYLYESGIGVEENGAKAAELYEKAMASDDFETRNVARFNLGRMYNRGAEGLAADITKTQELFQASADENYFDGWKGLGILYSAQGTVYGGSAELGVDYDKQFEYFSKEAELGCRYELGICYMEGKGCEQDFAKAFELFSQDARGGRRAAWAIVGLASLHISGAGVEKNLDTAADWCNKAIVAAGPNDVGVAETANQLLAKIAERSQT